MMVVVVVVVVAAVVVGMVVVVVAVGGRGGGGGGGRRRPRWGCGAMLGNMSRVGYTCVIECPTCALRMLRQEVGMARNPMTSPAFWCPR